MRTVEARARWLLRAWPLADRAERGDEILATTLDLVGTGRRRLPLRLSADLVLGGLKARHRARPPIWRWFRYACFAAVPAERQRWLESDVLRAGFRRRFWTRFVVTRGALVLPVGLLLTLVLGWLLSDRTLGLLISGVGGILGMPSCEPEAAVERVGARLAKEGRVDAALRVADHLLDTGRRPWPRRQMRPGPVRRRVSAASDLGVELLEMGREREATLLLAETFARGKEGAPEDDSTWSAGYHLAYALMTAGREDEAADVGREVLDGERRLHGASHPGTLATAAAVGAYLHGPGRLDEAIDLLADTFERGKRHCPADEWPTWFAGRELAAALARAGRSDEAEQVRAEVDAADRRCLEGLDRLDRLDRPTSSTAPGPRPRLGRWWSERLERTIGRTLREGSRRYLFRNWMGWLVNAALFALFGLHLARSGSWILAGLTWLCTSWSLAWSGFSFLAWRRCSTLEDDP